MRKKLAYTNLCKWKLLHFWGKFFTEFFEFAQVYRNKSRVKKSLKFIILTLMSNHIQIIKKKCIRTIFIFVKYSTDKKNSTDNKTKEKGQIKFNKNFDRRVLCVKQTFLLEFVLVKFNFMWQSPFKYWLISFYHRTFNLNALYLPY